MTLLKVDAFRSSFLFAILIALATLILFPFTGLTAQQTGTVQGTVTAADGTALNGATVSVQGTARGAITGAGGTYTIEDVPTGTQTVRVSYIGYTPATRQVTVRAGQTTTADFTISVDALSMEELIVTGTATEVRKLEASNAITTLNDEEIAESAPRSTADLLEAVPGYYIESSGGEVGNNVWARGIPQDGSYRYVAMYQDGLPIYESPELAFTNIDALHRTDETVSNMEAVRGGAASVFASNAPGGLINFVSKTGSEEGGVAKLTVGDYGLFRTDLAYGGELTDDWRFHVGGFYRFDQGVRDPGFPANDGGQVSANLTRQFEDGFIRLYGRYLNDRNIFYLPIPLQNPDSPEGIPGFDPNFGTMTSIDAGRVQIPSPTGTLEHDLRDGVHSEMRSVGAEAQFDLGDGWTIRDAFRVMSADVDFNAIFSIFNPVDAQTYGQQRATELGGFGFDYSYTHFDEDFDPATANGNGLVVESGWWNVVKPLDNFVNDLRVTRQLEDHSLTGGVYFSSYGADERWNFNNILLDVSDEARLLDLEVMGTPTPGGVQVTERGFTQFGAFYRNASSDAQVLAFYAQDEWRATEELRIDGGIRFEHARFNGNVEELETFDLEGPDTQARQGSTWGSGDFRPYDFEFDELAISIGANYSLSEELAVFGRVSDGFRMPDFDSWTDGTVNDKGEAEQVFQLEGGVKLGSPTVGLFATAFYSTLTDIPFVDEVVDETTGELITLRRFGDSRTIGLETELVYQPTQSLRIDLTSTLQRPEYTSLTFDVEPPPGAGEPGQFEGNRIRRIPEVILTVRPSYTVPGSGNVRLFGNIHYVGDRFVDDANNVTLPGWASVAAGLSFRASDRVRVQVNGDNLTNTIGLTEGNPRVGQVVGTEQDIYMARPILGRSARVSVAYTF